MTVSTVDEYADTLFDVNDELFEQMRAEAQAAGLPMIQVPPDLARLLSVLVAASGAKSALEIGTLFGYSGTLIARALPSDGILTTLEVNPTHAGVARKNFERAGVSSRVNLIEGDALQSLEGLEGELYDFVFIDADKPGYPQYLDAVLRLVHPGAVIVADNVWRHAGVIAADADEGNAALARFNASIASNPRLRSTLIPTRQGEDGAIVSVVLR